MTFPTAQAAAFYYMAAASLASAILAVTRKNPVHSMLWVLALFLHVAGIFLLLDAEFLAAVQIIVYAGAILVFYLFVLMLLDLPGEEARPRFGIHWPLAAAAGLGLVALTWLAQIKPVEPPRVGTRASPTQASPTQASPTLASPTRASATRAAEGSPLGSLSNVGKALFGPFSLPFEIASLVLLAAIVGAVLLARRGAES